MSPGNRSHGHFWPATGRFRPPGHPLCRGADVPEGYRVLAGVNYPERNVGALAMVERSEDGTGSVVEETIGDVVYGDGVTRQVFADAGRPLVAKLPRRDERKYFPKEDFEITSSLGPAPAPPVIQPARCTG